MLTHRANLGSNGIHPAFTNYGEFDTVVHMKTAAHEFLDQTVVP
jgi:hypothetical protein